jgi:ribosomal protein L37AE/L43A
MDPRVGRIILRRAKVEPNGRLLLEGCDRKQIRDHMKNCAPCHNPNIDLWQNPQRAKQDLDQACQVCKKTSVKAGGLGMLLCDRCNEGWHMSCMDPVVRKVPKGDWFCPRCAPRPETDMVT